MTTQVFYDASCSLCNNEMQTIKIHDTGQRLSLVDCSASDFDDTPYLPDSVTRAAMMECLHVKTAEGKWIKGVAAFELLYHTVDMPFLAALWGSRYTRPLAEIAYPWIARHRQLLTWTGAPLLFKLWGNCSARRANSRRCRNNQCSI